MKKMMILAVMLLAIAYNFVGAQEDEEQLARGEYIVRVAAACVECHADKDIYAPIDDFMEVPLQGGAAFEFEPFGTVYASNLTVLQAWSDQDIEQAIRYGVDPSGKTLLPPMPYDAYARMSDDDMAAAIAYLRTLEPVENTVPDAELIDGLTREAIRMVPELSDEPIIALDENATAEERGAYLGIAVAACVRCHGSLNEDGTLDLDGRLWGDPTINTPFGEFNSPALIKSELELWTDEDLLSFLNNQKPNGEPIFFMPMYAFQQLTDEDKLDLVVWLRSQE